MSMDLYDMINYNFPIGSKFDNNHEIPNVDLRSSSFGAIDTTSYEDIMKELSDVELQPYPTLDKLGDRSILFDNFSLLITYIHDL